MMDYDKHEKKVNKLYATLAVMMAIRKLARKIAEEAMCHAICESHLILAKDALNRLDAGTAPMGFDELVHVFDNHEHLHNFLTRMWVDRVLESYNPKLHDKLNDFFMQ